MNDYWLKYSQTLAQSLAATEVKSGAGEVLTMSAALPPLCLLAKEVHAVRGTIHFVGNGASACMASHMAVDWTKNAGVRALFQELRDEEIQHQTKVQAELAKLPADEPFSAEDFADGPAPQ